MCARPFTMRARAKCRGTSNVRRHQQRCVNTFVMFAPAAVDASAATAASMLLHGLLCCTVFTPARSPNTKHPSTTATATKPVCSAMRCASCSRDCGCSPLLLLFPCTCTCDRASRARARARRLGSAVPHTQPQPGDVRGTRSYWCALPKRVWCAPASATPSPDRLQRSSGTDVLVFVVLFARRVSCFENRSISLRAAFRRSPSRPVGQVLDERARAVCVDCVGFLVGEFRRSARLGICVARSTLVTY